ncbi:zinc finger MYM-type protein 1-like isoform X1 [Acipenser oxyrinchus oxyrinchus]|uniref:Zinc finger MYM-type protein 1-like isoform X1 n=1 Tax=Acipenser oxyrinchus oxyrinchus TaxID=40147 RepID=A0AAD8LVG6_ACIOX|nr:zinc finger MYM-type protein 1-like isoform X1 [Acipenser oxyrinchus oxyrinchus]
MTKYRIKNDNTVIAGLVKAERERISKNRQILKRLVDATLFLAKQGLAFRGHREYAGLGASGTNEGNFLELLKLLSKYDSLLDQHLKVSNRNLTYLSHHTQNELISCLAQETLKVITEEVKLARFFSVIVDSTVDIVRVDQFSLSLRYVTKTGHSSEHFIKFDELTSSCAEAFYNLLVNILTHELGLNVNFMRGQAYDGASTMSGHISGLQARVKEGCSSKAMYVHCCAHNLNLILIDAVSTSTSAKLFFGTLETLYSFLTSSLPRCRILEEE